MRMFAARSTMLAGLLGWAIAVFPQCANNNVLTGTAVTPPCPGTTTIPCVQGGQYALVNVVAGNIYTFSTCGASWDTQITLFNNAGGASLGYNDDFCGLQSTVTWTASFTGQLRVLVDRYSCQAGIFATCAPLIVTCSAGPPPVTNNEPCTATPVTVNANCSFSTFSNVGATNSAMTPAPGCGLFGAGSLDIWFSFVAPASGVVTIETQAGSMTDAAMALYADPPPADCAGPFTLVQCDDDSGPGFMPFLSFTGLNPGWTYYLRVWGYSSASGTFGLCLHGPTSIPPGGCVYLLELFDSFGNGWGTSSVGISINGGPFVDYSISGGYNGILIGLNIGDILVVQYTATGPNQGQNSYEISFLSGGATVFASGSPPAAGISYTQTISCIAPAPPPTDCIGSVTVCSGQSFNNNSSSTGSVIDLNASNQGCLSSGERQGTWYVFSPSAAGTIGFTIAPVVTTDYDFAVWGPYPAGSTPATICPPAGPPLRCSYAAPTGNTGVGNGATDPSEGAGGDRWVSTFNVLVGEVYVLYVDNFSINGQAFALSWQLTGGASLDCTVLPIELLSFEGAADGSLVRLHWATASEKDNDRFEIERSSEGVTFELLGVMDAAGTTVQRTDYHFTDVAPVLGLNYYRLKQVDTDGHFERSDVVAVQYVQASGALLVFPNPGSDAVSVILPEGTARGSQVVIEDALGRTLRTFQVDVEHPVLVPTDALPTGAYVLSLRAADGRTLAHSRWSKY